MSKVVVVTRSNCSDQMLCGVSENGLWTPRTAIETGIRHSTSPSVLHAVPLRH